MKWQALIVILAIALGVVIPPSSPYLYLADNGATASIGTLDVCHSSIPALSANGHMPFLNECPCQQLPLALYANPAIADPPLKTLLIVFQDERPPEA